MVDVHHLPSKLYQRIVPKVCVSVHPKVQSQDMWVHEQDTYSALKHSPQANTDRILSTDWISQGCTILSLSISSVDISNAQLQLQIQVNLQTPNCYSKIVDNLVAQLHQVGFRLFPSQSPFTHTCCAAADFSQSIQGRVVLQTDLTCHSSQEAVQALGTLLHLQLQTHIPTSTGLLTNWQGSARSLIPPSILHFVQLNQHRVANNLVGFSTKLNPSLNSSFRGGSLRTCKAYSSTNSDFNLHLILQSLFDKLEEVTTLKMVRLENTNSITD